MEEQQNNSNPIQKIIIGLLAILLLGSLVYISKISTESKQINKTLTTTMTEKDSIMKNLQQLKATYDEAIAKNTSISDELEKEREKVTNLMNEIKNSKGDSSSYKAQYLKLQSNMESLMLENKTLKKLNTNLISERDSTSVVLDETKKANQILSGQNEDMSKTIEKASKLTLLNPQIAAYQLKSSGKQVATEKASKTDILRITYSIAENQIAKPGVREYYIQVIDSKNNILGDKQTVNFNDKSLTYSFISKVKYENKSVNVSEDLPGKDFAKGTYFVNIFDKTPVFRPSVPF